MAGTALTLVAGPFVGSATGELVGRTLLLAGQAVEKRMLEPRRQKRLGEALSSAADRCRERLDQGESVRSDGFFDPRMVDGEIPAEEIAEGVLQTAADQWERRKVPYIGRLFANVAFNSDVSPSEASYLVRLTDRLSYRQFCLLALWTAASEVGSDYERRVIRLSAEGLKLDDVVRPSFLIDEMNDLGEVGLLGVTNSDGVVVPPGSTVGGLGVSFRTFDLETIHLTRAGEMLYGLLDLKLIPAADVEETFAAVRAATE